jgi:hypothetical protein
MINYVQPQTSSTTRWFRDTHEPNTLSCWDVKQGYWGTEELLSTIQEWSKDHKCGKRTSYDKWQFENEQDIMRFLLRWS